MGLSTASIGLSTDSVPFAYTAKDVALYALGVGATTGELQWVYEGADKKGPVVLPTFLVVPAFGPCEKLFYKLGGNLEGLVHGAQSIELHRALKPSDTLVTQARVEAMYDWKRFAEVILRAEMKSSDGHTVGTATMSLFFRMDGGFGGEGPPKRSTPKIPDRPADWDVQEKIGENQALLYRLSGDYNPLHADPDFAKRAGFDKPILHGLCTYGYVCRALVHHGLQDGLKSFKSLNGQFRAPVFPGETLRIEGWREDSIMILRASTLQPDKTTVVFDKAFAELNP